MAKSKNPKDVQRLTLLNDWEDFLHPPVPLKERVARGKKMRDEVPRAAHGEWQPPKHRPDSVELLTSQDHARLESLVPYRYGRMMESPFAFFRGAALIMASDLSFSPRTGINVQLCGDCHLSNFGIFATPERNIIFDLNDFDETLPGPFEWDVKRLAASFAVAAQSIGLRKSVGERCVEVMAKSYRTKMEEFAEMSTLDVWYHRIDWEYFVDKIKIPQRKLKAKSALGKLKEKRSHAAAVAKLTEMVDGHRQIKEHPPLLFRPPDVTREVMKELLNAYAKSLWPSRQRLLQRYRFVDVAVKVVGVGSVGTMAGIVLLQGEGGDVADDLILLQIKEANQSVLEGYLGRSAFNHPGERVVNGQRLLQAASDLFLGWTTGPMRTFYVRQLMDVKASVPIEELDADSLELYAQVCGYALARGHARTGDAAILYGYMGGGDSFDEALVKFASGYVKQNEADHDALLRAIKKGTIEAKTVE